jgi:hypothetical protein
MDNPKPWTFQEIMGSMAFTGQYTDIAAEGEPDLEAEDLRGQPGAAPTFPPDDSRQEEVDVPPGVGEGVGEGALELPVRPPRLRAQTKKKPRRRIMEDHESLDMDHERKRPMDDPQHVWRRLRFKTAFGPRLQRQPRSDITDLEEMQQEVLASYDQGYDLGENPTLVVIELPELETDRQWKELLRRPECYMANNLRRKRVEISERNATPAEKKLIQEGKQAEIKEFLQERVVST